MIKFLRLILISFKISIKFLVNLKHIREAKHIYINSDQFGHSVSDTLIFIESFGQKSLVVSLGTEFDIQPISTRNKFFDKCLGKRLIGIYFSKCMIKNGTWRLINPLSRKILQFFLFALANRDCLIYVSKNEFLRTAYLKIIPKKLDVSSEDATTIVNKLDFKVYTGRIFLHPLGRLSFLLNNTKINSTSIYMGANKSLQKKINERLLNNSFVCLAIRKGNSPYNSDSDYYFDAIDTLHSAGFMVSIIGDRKNFLEMARKSDYSTLQKTNNSDLNERDQRIFELLAIENCKFVIGDQGGVWSLVKAFNKPGLLINASPNSQLQNNVESFPKKWVYQINGREFLDAKIIFGELFFKWTQESKIFKTFEEQQSYALDVEAPDRLISQPNDNDEVMKVLKRYLENSVYLSPNKMSQIVTKNCRENVFLQIAENASYSEDYINKLTW